MSTGLFGGSDAATTATAAPASNGLQITPAAAGAALTPQHKRFNSLIRLIAQARKDLAKWHENLDLYRKADAQLLAPLRKQLQAESRKWVFALDEQLDRRGWNRAERETIATLIREGAACLLDDNEDSGAEDDAELSALYAKHSEFELDAGRQQTMLALKKMTQAMTGMDLGADEGINSPADLFQRMQDGMRAKLDQEQAQAGGAHSQQKNAAGRHKAQALQATQSVREVYRKLASALHPDRETDTEQRAAKTVLMQKVNQAYAANDLLGLLELQLQIEQIDADHLANVSAQRLKHYNQVLAEQLSQLQMQSLRIEMGFRMDFGLMLEKKLRLNQFAALLEACSRDLRAELAQQQRNLRMLADQAQTKRWLKAERHRQREEDFESDLGFAPFF